ncbi:glycosyltransferase [Pseudoclavibacter endophyticus]|uniref:glycosyltransferase n=1 Tax=Pseudoclavibacter endophyticus TaxID=1778590 RepID=UPI00130102D2|nr:glycosyltransferase family 2 protein [Pseudoclavibacter endophyticus]
MLGTLSVVAPVWAGVFVLVVVGYMFVKGVRLGVHAIRGSANMRATMRVPWHQRLAELERAQRGGGLATGESVEAHRIGEHLDNLRLISGAPDAYPNVGGLYNAVIVPAYNESFDLIAPTMQSLIDTTFDNDRLIVVFAYEARGGVEMQRTAERLERMYGHRFASFQLVQHPADQPGEVPGKGANITYAARRLRDWLDLQGIGYDRVIVTSLDCDNRPHPAYFDLVTYEYVLRSDRKRLSFQPISIFTNNIWDAPAPSRVIASGNSIWNIVSSLRPRALRNFASHAQPMDALVEMDFWSTRTIVEDGHQYWRSWFHFDGDYRVVSVPVPIYQDVVLAETFWRTMKAQLSQLRRWAYGASDVPFVAVRVLSRRRRVRLGEGLFKLVQLLESHVTLSCVALIIMCGPWVPLVVNGFDRNLPAFVVGLPFIVGTVQQFAMLLLIISIWVSMTLLPARPERVAPIRTLFMVVQWVLFPVTTILFNASSAIISQSQLAIGKYREVFVVTEKFAVVPVAATATATAPATGPIAVEDALAGPTGAAERSAA